MQIDTIKNPFSFSTSTQTVAHPRFSENHFLYFFQIVKDQTFVVRRQSSILGNTENWRLRTNQGNGGG